MGMLPSFEAIAPSWQTGVGACGWTHIGSIKLSSLREGASQSECIRCRILLEGIEKYTFLPHRPDRTTEAHIEDYEPTPGLNVHVTGKTMVDRELPLRVTVHFPGMTAKAGSLPMELFFYSHSGQCSQTRYKYAC